MTDLPARSRFQIGGWHVLAAVVGFFAIVIAVDVSFAVFAYRTFPGEVSATPYEDGVAYNRTLAQMARQAKLGWTPVASVAADGGLRLQVRDAAGHPVRGLRVTARMERPATETGRLALTFQETEPGVYRARPAKVTGAWDVSLALVDPAGRRFEAERRLLWP